jgi:hypothetical protein
MFAKRGRLYEVHMHLPVTPSHLLLDAANFTAEAIAHWTAAANAARKRIRRPLPSNHLDRELPASQFSRIDMQVAGCLRRLLPLVHGGGACQ